MSKLAGVVDPSDTETGLSEDAAGSSFMDSSTINSAGTCHAPDFGELH